MKLNMSRLRLFFENKKPQILCLGAHSDDIEIGCGGTIIKLLNELPESSFYWVVFSGDAERAREAKQSANIFLEKVQSKTIEVKDYKESYFPYIGSNIKDFFETLKKRFSPDLIFTHYMNDAHQDHRLISDLTWNTFRNHLILEYEIPKYDGDLGTPNCYVHLDENIVRKKLESICRIFNSQKNKQWFTEDTFEAMLRIRGVESNSPTKYAEAFHCRKFIL